MPAADSFRIAVLGDFSGTCNSASAPLIRPVRVDRENISEVMEHLDVKLRDLQFLPDSPRETISFGCMDDFHPDRLFERLEVFASLRLVREQLQTPELADEAIALISGWMNPQASAVERQATDEATKKRGDENADPQRPSAASQPTPAAASANLLDSILDSSVPESTSSGRAGEGDVSSSPTAQWDAYIASIAAPYATEPTQQNHKAALEWLDQTIQKIMQRIVSLPQFQELEARWRGLQLLVQRLETGPELKVFVINADRECVARDLAAEQTSVVNIASLLSDEDAEGSALWHYLVTEAAETEGGEPWSLILADYCFGTDDADVQVLAKLGAIAETTGVPLIAGAELARLTNVANPSWQELRRSSSAAYLALAWPRFLVRLPYGASTKPIESFEFDELAGVDPPRLLWTNGAYLVALLIGQAFSENGWGMELGEITQVDNLPLWLRAVEGETEIHPCGEKLLTDSAAEQLLKLGLLPIVSIRDQDSIRVPWFNSLCSQPLRWSNA